MGKIKGWKLQFNRPTRIVWFSKSSGRFKQLIVSRSFDAYTSKKRWRTSTLKSTPGIDMPNNIEVLFEGTTKQQALDYAMKYMRSHQDG